MAAHHSERFTRPLLLPSLALAALVLILSACESTLDAPSQAPDLASTPALELLPADARMVGHINLASLHSNPALQPSDGMTLHGDLLPDEAQARLQTFLTATRFDPGTDLQSVYVALSEPTGGPAEVSLVAYASFDRTEVHAHLQQLSEPALSESTYRGIDLLVSTGETPLAVAIANDEMVLAATSQSRLEAMIDRLADGTPGLTGNAPMVDLIRSATAGRTGWVVTKRAAGSSQTLPAGASPEAQLAHLVDDIGVSFDVDADGLYGSVMLVTRPGTSTKDVARVTEGMVAAAKAAPDVPQPLVSSLDRMHVQSHADRVVISGSLTTEALQALRSQTR